jgi:flagellar hook-associated protein 3 FlgL
MSTRPLSPTLSRALAQINTERSLPRARAEMSRLNEQMATGLRISRASDDPNGFVRARALQRHEDRLGQHERTIDTARLWTDATQSEVDAIANLFTEARELGLQGANTISDRDALVGRLTVIRDEVIERLNTRVDGEYLFAGNQTNVRPLDATGAVAAGDFSGRREREIAPGVSFPINVPGSDALLVDGTAAPERLQALIDGIAANDAAAIQTALDGVETGSDHYIRLGARAGETARRLSSARDQIESEKIVAATHRSAVEDADLADVLGQIQRRQTGLEASLRATASILQTSLLDYLR